MYKNNTEFADNRRTQREYFKSNKRTMFRRDSHMHSIVIIDVEQN